MNKLFSNNKTGMTLVEILVATIILGIVLLTAGTIYISSIKELARSVDEAKVQREASFALDHIFLNLLPAKDIDASIVFPSTSIIVVTDDTTVPKTKIKYSLSGTDLWYYPPYTTTPVNPEIIATGITSLRFDRQLFRNSDGSAGTLNNYISIFVTATGDRMYESYSTGVTLRGMSG